jgi:hypothetical protein
LRGGAAVRPTVDPSRIVPAVARRRARSAQNRKNCETFLDFDTSLRSAGRFPYRAQDAAESSYAANVARLSVRMHSANPDAR